MGKSLDPPPIAANDDSVEVLRVWTVENSPVQLVLNTTWKDPGAWGLLIVDIARHVSKAFGKEGFMTEQDALTRIRQLFDAEWAAPTDTPMEID